jgi:hypothetical protein
MHNYLQVHQPLNCTGILWRKLASPHVLYYFKYYNWRLPIVYWYVTTEFCVWTYLCLAS